MSRHFASWCHVCTALCQVANWCNKSCTFIGCLISLSLESTGFEHFSIFPSSPLQFIQMVWPISSSHPPGLRSPPLSIFSLLKSTTQESKWFSFLSTEHKLPVADDSQCITTHSSFWGTIYRKWWNVGVYCMFGERETLACIPCSRH